MSCMTILNAEVRRKDGRPVSDQDLMDFEEAWMAISWAETYDHPHIAISNHNQHRIFASGAVWHSFESADMRDFAKSHPHLQMEILADCEDLDVGNTRILYEGDVVEELFEVKFFEKPEKIKWDDAPSPYKKLLDDADFCTCLGEQIMYAIQDMLDNENKRDLAQYVLESVIKYPAAGEDMFSAVVGWALDDLIARANDSLAEFRKE